VADADESIGSLGQETLKLLRALAAERLRAQDPAEKPVGPDASAASTHVCTTSWCPICQVVGYVQDHPELVEQVTETVTDAAIQVGRVVRDFLDKTIPPDGPRSDL
jgi:hypothetical protein